MPLKKALEQYQKCQECLYVDDCPNREDRILAAFAVQNEMNVNVKCKNEKENDIYED